MLEKKPKTLGNRCHNKRVDDMDMCADCVKNNLVFRKLFFMFKIAVSIWEFLKSFVLAFCNC